jgi:hypothetical protein
MQTCCSNYRTLALNDSLHVRLYIYRASISLLHLRCETASPCETFGARRLRRVIPAVRDGFAVLDLRCETCGARPAVRDLRCETFGARRLRRARPAVRDGFAVLDLRCETCGAGPAVRDLRCETCGAGPAVRDLRCETCGARPAVRDLRCETALRTIAQGFSHGMRVMFHILF